MAKCNLYLIVSELMGSLRVSQGSGMVGLYLHGCESRLINLEQAFTTVTQAFLCYSKAW